MAKRTLVKWISLSILVCFLSPLPLKTSAEDLTGTAPAPFSTNSLQLPGGVVVFGSPTIADLTGDGIPEVLIATTSQTVSQQRTSPMRLVAVRGDDSILWQAELPAPANSHPAVGDLDGDGRPEIVVTTGGDSHARAYQGKLVAFDHNGNRIWDFAFLDDYPQDGYADGGISSPTLCDVDTDGKMEIIVGGWDRRIHLLSYDGTSRWHNLNYANAPAGPGYFNWDTTWSTAACADLNDDGNKEIVIGADSSGGGTLPDGTPTYDGGFLYVFDKDGNVLARRFVDETVMSSPAIGDLDNDGSYEIVVGTGFYWWLVKGGRQPRVHAFSTANVFESSISYHDPARLPALNGWPQDVAHPSYSSPALADLDGDDDLEIVVGAGDLFKGTGGSAYAWHHDGQAVQGWPIAAAGPIMASPVVADINGDQIQEILMPDNSIRILGPNGDVNATLVIHWPAFFVSPAVGDTDGDGRADIWVGGGNLNGDHSSGYLWHFRSAAGELGVAAWPQFHGDAHNSGFYLPPHTVSRAAKMTVASQESLLLFDTQAGRLPDNLTAEILISNTGGKSFDWTARFSTVYPAHIAPTAGTLGSEETTKITLQVGVSDLLTETATYELGQLVVDATSVDGALPTQQVTIRLYVGPVSYLYLPVLRR